MDLLKQRIIDDGIIVSTEIVKVDSFLNQQLDVKLFEEIGNTMNEQFYSSETKSFTKGNIYDAIVSKKYLSKNDKILIIDDFMAHGEAAYSLANLALQAESTVVGIVAVIEKYYQGGSTKLRNLGYRVETLASIEKIKDGRIFFR